MSAIGRPQGPVRSALQAAIHAGEPDQCEHLAAVCGVPIERARATVKEIRRAARRRRSCQGFDTLAFLREAWR